MPYFVLEIGTEEMPARFLPGLSAELKDRFEKGFAELKLDATEAVVHATPRRLAVCFGDLSLCQRVEEEVVAGPPKKVAFDAAGALTKAGLGFAKTQGVAPEALFVMETPKGEYLAARKTSGGKTAPELLPDLIVSVISGLSFPKKMRWGSRDFAFGRPIRWLLALLDDQIVPVELAGLTSNRLTWGHRVMGPGPFTIDSAADYARLIEEKGRIRLDSCDRLKTIMDKGDALAGEVGGKVAWSRSLLEEVSNLVEYPEPVLGRFDDSYLELPREVLLTSMESHQKSFGVEDAGGKLLPYFLATINIAPTSLGLVRKGWERVLKARLEDARFFWKSDLSSDFDAWLRKLENVVFLGPLGSMGDKSRRLQKLCGWLAETLKPEMTLELSQAGRLAKADLVSHMVGEFADLQGVMGGIYAGIKGETPLVSQAISEQYLPTGQDSPVPSTLAGALLAMADKADTLAGCFGLNMVPTGANDPYALRRAVLGVCRIALDHDVRFRLEDLLAKAQEGYGEVKWKVQPTEALAKLMDFFGQRLKAFFQGRGHETLIVEAALGAGFSDVRGLEGRIGALSRFSQESDFGQAVLTFKRAANIIRKQAQDAALSGAYDPSLFQEQAERDLAAKLEEVAPRWDSLWSNDAWDDLLSLLRELRPNVDAFFDNVMVMAEDKTLRDNRLNLLKSLVDRLSRLADFSALQV